MIVYRFFKGLNCLGISGYKMGGSNGRQPRWKVRQVAKHVKKRVQLRSVVGTIERKNNLKCAYLNVDYRTQLWRM